MSDLRRDLNSLRKRLDETRALDGAQGFSSQLIDSKLHLIERAGSGSYSILAENGKSAPQGICLECHDYFST